MYMYVATHVHTMSFAKMPLTVKQMANTALLQSFAIYIYITSPYIRSYITKIAYDYPTS